MNASSKFALRAWLCLIACASGLLLLVHPARSQTSPQPPAATAPATATTPVLPDGTVVTAKLVEIPSKLPPDDLYDYAYVMRYQVVGGPFDKASILVAHYKPLLPRAKITGKMKGQIAGKLRSFVQGDVHKLKLASDVKKVWKGPLIDEFAATDHSSVRYWCSSADPG